MSRNYGDLNENNRIRLLKLLEDMQWHPHYELLGPGGICYSSRIRELRRLGYKIEGVDLGGDDKQGRVYRLLSLEKGEPLGKKVKIYLEERDTVALLMDGVLTAAARREVSEALSRFIANKPKL
jgi:hypothetical protein